MQHQWILIDLLSVIMILERRIYNIKLFGSDNYIIPILCIPDKIYLLIWYLIYYLFINIIFYSRNICLYSIGTKLFNIYCHLFDFLVCTVYIFELAQKYNNEYLVVCIHSLTFIMYSHSYTLNSQRKIVKDSSPREFGRFSRNQYYQTIFFWYLL